MVYDLVNATPEQVISCRENRRQELKRLLLEMTIVEDELSRLEEIVELNRPGPQTESEATPADEHQLV